MLNDLLGLFAAHNYLAIAIVATLYLRTLCGPNSKFPVTISPRWQPTVTAGCGLAYGFESAMQGGDTVAQAALAALALGAGSGFFDGLLVAIFNGANAPNWAKAIVFLVDDVAGKGGGGGSSGGGSVSKLVPKAGAGFAAAGVLLFALGAVPALTGCPQATTAIVPTAEFVDCVWNKYQSEPAGTPILTVVADEIATCGGDMAQVISVLDKKESRAAHAASAHAPVACPIDGGPTSDLERLEGDRAIADGVLNAAGAGAQW